MARKTKAREELEKLSADAQEIFHIVALKERYAAYVGVTADVAAHLLSRQRGKVVSKTELPAFVKGVEETLLALQQGDFLASEPRGQGTIYFLTKKGDEAFE